MSEYDGHSNGTDMDSNGIESPVGAVTTTELSRSFEAL